MPYNILLSSILTFALSGDPTPQKPAPRPIPGEGLNKTTILRLVNKFRSTGGKCGDTFYPAAPALTWNDQLEQAALVHSKDMQTRKYFNHYSPEGNNAGERIDAVGYRWMTFGENIGLGYKNENEVVEAWKQSPGHCKNMLNPKYKEMGVARVGQYWTQNFGSR